MQDAATIAVAWAHADGWNPGRDDAQRLVRADPGAFLCTQHDGAVVATVSCALYGDDYAFIGFYIVHEDFRGQGLGLELFDRALARAGDRVVGLDGVLEQQEAYERSGFELAHRNTRYESSGGGTRPPGLVDLDEVPRDELLAYDASIFGTRRDAFLETWISDRPPGMALAVRNGDGLCGYAIGRRCGKGVKAGPLFADDPETADALFRGLAAAAGDRIYLDVPEPNADAEALARRYALQPVFATARMYRGGTPDEDVARVYGVTTFEFG